MINSQAPDSNEIENNFNGLSPSASARQVKNEGQVRKPKARKEAKFTARLNQDDFAGMKRVALEKAIPYQTLLGHIIHLYIEGQLVDVTEVQKIFELKKIG